MSKTPMTSDAAARIQSHADRTGQNQDFKSRAQSAANRHQAQAEAERPSGESQASSEANKKQR